MIWIIGGTSETGKLLEKIRGRIQYIITVATESGKDVLASEEQVLVGRMTIEQMRGFIREHAIQTVVDLTHPYATEVTQNARQVCQEQKIRYLRYVRETSEVEGAVHVHSVQECVAFLKSISGCVFFTTGSKNIPEFQKVRGKNRFVYRVLPTVPSLEICSTCQVEIKDIVAAVGPFSEALNVAMFGEYQADYVVMKDSGTTGGTPEKLTACARLGITPIVLVRAKEEGIGSIEDLAKILRLGQNIHRRTIFL